MDILGLVDIPLYVLLMVGTLILLYIFSTWNHNFFIKQGIPGPKPYPFLGNIIDPRQFQLFRKWRKLYGNVFGFFLGRVPAFVISDHSILKEVFVKSFDNFSDRRRVGPIAYPLNLNMLFLEGAAWKRVRTIITPTFSGAKLKGMCSGINDCARTLTNNFKKTLDQKKSVDTNTYFGGFTMDVISRTAFGIKVDSQSNFNEPFVKHVKALLNQNHLTNVLALGLSALFPSLIGFFSKIGLSIFSHDTVAFFQTTITSMIRQRKSESKEVHEKRHDFLQLMLDVEVQGNQGDVEGVGGPNSDDHPTTQKTHKRLTTDEIVAQAILFIAAGYETTATTLTFASYTLATHPDVQEKLYQEIVDVLGKSEPNYDNIHELKYLENVIKETLRLYTPAPTLNRRASETITMNGVTIPAGSTVFVPVYSMQRDPEIFQDPEVFRPERHDEKCDPLSFLSFGYGPRACIGMRLALVEIKIALVHVLRSVKFEVGPDTPIPVNYETNILLKTSKPIMLNVSPRC